MTHFLSQRNLALACLVCSALFYGTAPVFLHWFASFKEPNGGQLLDSWTVNALRYGISAIFWLPVVFRNSPSTVIMPDGKKRNVWRDALIPSFVNLLGQTGWAICPYYLRPAVIGFSIKLSFPMTILLGFIFIAGERRLIKRPLFWAGTMGCLAGVAIMFWATITGGNGNFTKGQTPAIGFAVLIVTAMFWAAYSVAVGRFMSVHPVRKSFAVISIYTTAGLVALMFIMGRCQNLAQTPWAVLCLIALSGVICIALSHVMFYKGIKTFGPLVASGVTMGTPFATYVYDMIVSGDAAVMTWMQNIGGLLIIGGAVGLLLAERKVQRS